jgi:hypothetical protein
MSAKAIREYHGKKLASRWLSHFSGSTKYDLEDRALLITPSSIRPEDPTSFDALAKENPWLLETKLVVKPDQLIKRRGKAGLLAINKTWPEVVQWIKERMNKECQVEIVSGILDHFIVEPFVPHKQSDEYYLCIQVRFIHFYHSLYFSNCLYFCRASAIMTRFSSTTKVVSMLEMSMLRVFACLSRSVLIQPSHL